MIALFGTPQDITVDERRVEAFFPADDATANFLRPLAALPLTLAPALC